MADRRAEPSPGESISRETCLRLLAEEVHGHLRTAAGPCRGTVDYLLDETTVVFHADPSTESEPSGEAAFEVDGSDVTTRAAWTVVVSGHLEPVSPSAAATFERLHCLHAGPWRGGPRPRWVRLTPTRISGVRAGR